MVNNARMVQAVDYFDAWRLWADGNEALRNTELWGLPVFWWGRIGKVLAFLAGFTILLDLIGPERIREYSKNIALRLRRHDGKRFTNETIGMGGGFLGMILAIEVIVPRGTPLWVYVVVVPLCSVVGISLSVLLRAVFSTVLNRNSTSHMVRWLSLACFLIGFHFDMLAS